MIYEVRRATLVEVKCYSAILQVHNDNTNNKTQDMKYIFNGIEKACQYLKNMPIINSFWNS